MFNASLKPSPFGADSYQTTGISTISSILTLSSASDYPLTEIKEIIPGKGANLTKARQQESDAKIPNEKSNMQVVLEPLSGTAKDNLKRANLEIERLLAFRGSVTSAKAKGTKITVEFEINPKWDMPGKTGCGRVGKIKAQTEIE